MSNSPPPDQERTPDAIRGRLVGYFGYLARQIEDALFDLKNRSWIGDYDTQPKTRLRSLLQWTEATVRRFILSLVFELIDAGKVTPVFPKPPKTPVEGGAPAETLGGYSPSFRWSETRRAPSRRLLRVYFAPIFPAPVGPLFMRISARVAHYAHMLDNAERYAERLASRLLGLAIDDVARRQVEANKGELLATACETSSTADPSDLCPMNVGETPVPRLEVEGEVWAPDTFGSGVSEQDSLLEREIRNPGLSVAQDRDPEREDEFEAGGQNIIPTYLTWELYATPPPFDELRDDLIALHLTIDAG